MPALLLLAAWISGTAALVAETMWFRALGRGVGTSAEALAVVSASFLGGLGLGAAIASRRAPRSGAPLRAAAVCEACAGVLIALSPLVLPFVPDAHLALLALFRMAPGPNAWPAALAALPILVIPTAFLGATLPFLVRGRVRSVGRAGRWTGLLYGVNTFGAACGTAGALRLLFDVGESASLKMAGAGNLLAALLLLVADGWARPSSAAVVDDDVAPPPAAGADPLSPPPAPADATVPATVAAKAPANLPPRRGGRAPWSPAVALFATGALALGGEVAWFRLLEPITGIHVFGFGVLLISVLVGTALGGLAGGALADRVRRPDLWLAAVVTLAGLATAASIAVAGAVPSTAVRWATSAASAARDAHASTDDVARRGYDAIFQGRLLGAVLTVVPPLFLFAIAYPLAVRARARTAAGAAGEAGSIYAWNTLGNVVGSLLAGFLLLPALGGPATLLLLGGVGVAAGAVLWLRAAPPRPLAVAALLALPLAPACLPGALDRAEALGPSLPEVVAMGRWLPEYQVASRADFRAFAAMVAGTYPSRPGDPDARPIRPREGVMSTVGLLMERGSVRVRQGGLSEAKILPRDPDVGTETEVALALVPYLTHPHPRDALVIGHGAGWTAETMIATQIAHVDVAELEPAVLDVVEAYRGPLLVRRAPNARLHLADGRLLLRQAADAGGRYDLVVSQPSHPWVPGAGHLFTKDAYGLARAALRDGGVFAQWMNIFNMSEALFRTALASWHAVFPDGWVLVYADEVILVGFRTPPVVDPARWRHAIDAEAVGEKARAAGITGPEDVLRHLLLDGDGLTRVLGADPLVSTDDEPVLETGLAWTMFRGDRSVGEKPAIYRLLGSAFPPAFERFLPDARARDALLASTALRVVATMGVEEGRRFTEVPFDGGVVGRRARARAWLAQARESKASADDRRRLRHDAIALLGDAVRLAPDDPDLAREWLAVRVDHGDAAGAATDAAGLAARFPDHGPLLAEQARALMTVHDEVGAERAFRAAMAATKPRAPAGTGGQLARRLTSKEPADVVGARDVLRADASAATDREALRRLRQLELETAPATLDETPEIRRVDERLKAAEATWALERLEVARSTVEGVASVGLEAARDATSVLTSSSEAWRLRAWYELRGKDVDAAVASLARAIRYADDPDAARRTARGLLRLFGAGEREIPAEEPR